MKKYTNKSAFTLVELMVVIAVIMIIGTAGARLDFNYIGGDQKLTTMNNKLVSQFETIRNNSLFGRGIDASIGVPESWRIQYGLTGSGESIVSYNMTGSAWIPYPEQYIYTEDFYSFHQINCISLDATSTPVSTGTLVFQGANITLAGGCNGNHKKLEFKTHYKQHKSDIKVNIITGIMETK
ncbi:MAG: type II secretion system protein [Candidatus Gracilibacteria bacterium]|nr:type II secretion system protein [Candidatus Gracilibacteria bacterium]